MIPEYIRISVGQLYKVDRSFWTSGEHTSDGLRTKRYITKGSIIEIRYPYEWHFRTEGNVYCHAKPEALIKYCTFFGKIHEDVRFNNKHKLKEIIEDGLYTPASGFKLVNKEG